MHGPWRLNATKYILDIKLSIQMYICISRRWRLSGTIFFVTFGPIATFRHIYLIIQNTTPYRQVDTGMLYLAQHQEQLYRAKNSHN